MNPDFLASAAEVGPLGTIPLTEGFADDAEILGGEYLLLGKVGEGGSGEVYRALQVSTRREVAVKRLRLGHSDARFGQEVLALGRLRHPGIAALIQAGMHGGRPFLVQEFVGGGSLADRLLSGRIAPKEAARIVREAAEAIGHAHRAGVVHRDLKPGNLLLDGEGRVRVTDFSVAKDLGSDGAVTLDGQAVGTPAYMAPEQADGRRGTVGPLTDVYGLGATLYHALTGRAPMEGADAAETMRRVAAETPDWGEAWRDIHRDLKTVCMRAMHPESARRYPSAQALADDLGRFLDGMPVQARPVTLAERCVRWLWRPWPMAAAATLVALVAGAVVAGSWVGRGQRTRVEALLRDWPMRTPEPIHIFSLGNGATSGLRASFTEDGRLFAFGASDGNLRFASVEPAHLVANSLKRTAPVRFHRFLPGTARRRLFVAAEDGLWRLWTAGSVRRVFAEGRAEGGVVAFDATADGTRFAVGAASGEVTGWKLAETGWLQEFGAHCGGGVVGVHYVPESGRLLSVARSRALECWDLKTDAALWSRQLPNVPTASATSPGRELMAVAMASEAGIPGGRGWVRFLRTEDGVEVGAFQVREAPRSVVFSPDGTRVLVMRDDPQFQVWDTHGKRVLEIGGNPANIVGGEFSPDGLRLLTWDAGGTARIWDAHTGEPLSGLWSGPVGIAHATFSPDGWRIGSGDRSPTGTLWDVGCPVPAPWDRASLTAALVRQGSLAALRRAAWLNPSDGGVLRRLAAATRRESRDAWREQEAGFLEGRAETRLGPPGNGPEPAE